MHSYIRTPRAAVAAPLLDDDREPAAQRQAPNPRGRTQTLWASRPLAVRAGRLIAVRLRGEDLRVGLATPDGVRWVRPGAVLTSAQAQAWVATSTFTEWRRPPSRG